MSPPPHRTTMTSTNFTVNSDRLDPVLLHDYVQASLVESPFIRAGGCPEQLGAPGLQKSPRVPHESAHLSGGWGYLQALSTVNLWGHLMRL